MSQLTFPCEFPLKIVGNNTSVFFEDIKAITKKHFPLLLDEKISHKNSNKGNYLAITIRVVAQNQKSLDALYQDLTKHPDIKMVL